MAGKSPAADWLLTGHCKHIRSPTLQAANAEELLSALPAARHQSELQSRLGESEELQVQPAEAEEQVELIVGSRT